MKARSWLRVCSWHGHPFKSAAEPVQVLETEYKPLITTRSGIPELCGFHFSTIVVRASGQLVNIQGSMNTSFYAGRVPASMIKVSAVQQGEGVLKRVAILDASIRLGPLYSQIPEGSG